MCVIWPFHLSPTVGYIAAGFVAFITLVQYMVGLVKRSMQAPAL